MSFELSGVNFLKEPSNVCGRCICSHHWSVLTISLHSLPIFFNNTSPQIYVKITYGEWARLERQRVEDSYPTTRWSRCPLTNSKPSATCLLLGGRECPWHVQILHKQHGEQHTAETSKVPAHGHIRARSRGRQGTKKPPV